MTARDSFRYTLTTADSVSFSVQLASPLLRAYALLIDLLVIIGVQILVHAALQVLWLLNVDVFTALYLLSSFLLNLGYFLLLEWTWSGQTVGKRIVGLRVMDAQSRRLGGGQVVLRTLFRLLDMFPYFYFTGGVVAICSPRFQRLGDLVAGTLVIRTPRVSRPPIQDLPPVKFNSLRAYPRTEAHLRREVSPEEAVCIVHALLRRDQLDPAARLQVLGDMADTLRNRLRLPPELETLSDEVFLRNCVDTLYRDLKVL